MRSKHKNIAYKKEIWLENYLVGPVVVVRDDASTEKFLSGVVLVVGRVLLREVGHQREDSLRTNDLAARVNL
jgi:hypothetical protein